MTFVSKRVQEIKKAQKEKLLFREVSSLFLGLKLENKLLENLLVSKIELSPDKGICFVYFVTPHGESSFNELLDVLKLYKPSLRKAIASKIESRHTPEIVFKYDAQYEKQERILQILDKVKPSSDDTQ